MHFVYRRLAWREHASLAVYVAIKYEQRSVADPETGDEGCARTSARSARIGSSRVRYCVPRFARRRRESGTQQCPTYYRPAAPLSRVVRKRAARKKRVLPGGLVFICKQRPAWITSERLVAGTRAHLAFVAADVLVVRAEVLHSQVAPVNG